jgi:hypothetical protein
MTPTENDFTLRLNNPTGQQWTIRTDAYPFRVGFNLAPAASMRFLSGCRAANAD